MKINILVQLRQIYMQINALPDKENSSDLNGNFGELTVSIRVSTVSIVFQI